METTVNNKPEAKKHVVIDGCETDFAEKLPRKAAFAESGHLCVTDRGFEKGGSPSPATR